MTSYLIFAAIAFVGVLLIARFLRRANIVCDFCQESDCKVWGQVPEDTRQKILPYFRSREGREPDTKAFLVCDACRIVFDDFSGKCDSPEANAVSFGWGPSTRVLVMSESWCKVCNQLMQSCEPDNDNIHCRACGTTYKWQTHEESGYRFLMPPEGTTVKERCRDLSASGVLGEGL